MRVKSTTAGVATPTTAGTVAEIHVTSDDSIQVLLDFPPRELSPNARLKWPQRAPFIKAYRHACRIEALNVRRDMEKRGGRFPLPSPVTVIVTFILTDNQRRDMDNLIASFKSGQDGALRDAGVVEDDSIQVISRIGYEWERGARAGVRVTIEGAR